MLCYEYKRNHINKMIREMATEYKVAFKDAYNILYSEFSKQSGTDIHLVYQSYFHKNKMQTLEDLEKDNGFLTLFYNIVKKEYKNYEIDKKR
jgi:hypothetical protein